MAYEIIATKEFRDDVENTIDWLRYKWTEKEIDKFEKKLLSVIQQIGRNPAIGKISSRRKDIRSIIVTAHNRLYYQVFDTHITLHNLVETKRDPKRNKFE